MAATRIIKRNDKIRHYIRGQRVFREQYRRAKTSISWSFSRAIASSGRRVTFFDEDVYERLAAIEKMRRFYLGKIYRLEKSSFVGAAKRALTRDEPTSLEASTSHSNERTIRGERESERGFAPRWEHPLAISDLFSPAPNAKRWHVVNRRLCAVKHGLCKPEVSTVCYNVVFSMKIC